MEKQVEEEREVEGLCEGKASRVGVLPSDYMIHQFIPTPEDSEGTCR